MCMNVYECALSRLAVRYERDTNLIIIIIIIYIPIYIFFIFLFFLPQLVGSIFI